MHCYNTPGDLGTSLVMLFVYILVGLVDMGTVSYFNAKFRMNLLILLSADIICGGGFWKAIPGEKQLSCFVLWFAYKEQNTYNTQKQKGSEKWGRPGNTYYVSDVRWMRGRLKGAVPKYKYVLES